MLWFFSFQSRFLQKNSLWTGAFTFYERFYVLTIATPITFLSFFYMYGHYAATPHRLCGIRYIGRRCVEIITLRRRDACMAPPLGIIEISKLPKEYIAKTAKIFQKHSAEPIWCTKIMIPVVTHAQQVRPISIVKHSRCRKRVSNYLLDIKCFYWDWSQNSIFLKTNGNFVTEYTLEWNWNWSLVALFYRDLLL